MRKFAEIKNLMYSIANRIKLQTEDAQDLVHAAWATGKMDRCEEYALSKVITNAMLDHRRKTIGRKGSPKFSDSIKTVSLSSVKCGEGSYIDKSLGNLENKEITEKLLNLLDSHLEKVVSFRIYKGWTFARIGEELGILEQTAMERFNKAIEQLRSSKLIRDIM